MVPWHELGRAKVPDGELVLTRRGDEFAIRLHGAELMNSRSHHSEEQLAQLGCAGLAEQAAVHVLVGGLGMGFTARAALDALGPDAHVTIVELVPEVVAWNREHLGDLARRPLDDPRVEVHVGDVAQVIGTRAPVSQTHAGGTPVPRAWHAILLDVDNGPDAFTAPANAALYAQRGLVACKRALVPGGALAVWSVADDRGFTGRLTSAGFTVERHRVPARPTTSVKHVVWIARR